MKYHWRNGKTRLFHFKRSISITRDLFTHKVTGISIAFWFLMHFLVSCWYTQLPTLELKLLSLPLRNGYFLLEFLNLLYETEELLSKIPTSLTGTKDLGVTLRPRTAHSPWTNGIIETQNQHIARYWGKFLNDARNNWSSLAPKFVFAHNKVMKYTTGKTPNEVVFHAKPPIPLSLKLELYRNKDKFCCSEFCRDLPSLSHSENNLMNHLLDNRFDHNFHKHFWSKNVISKGSIVLHSKDVESKQQDRMPTEIDSIWDST